MFLCSTLPSWKQIFTNKASTEKLFWENKPSLLFSESCVSLRLLFSIYRRLNNKERVLIYLPDYFCDQTIQSFREDWMDFYYYPIGEDFEPQWKSIEEYTKSNCLIPDFFVFVHYFGMEKNVSLAADFCKRHNALLVEDCAHVLLAKGKIASKGDFVIFSPHKQLPVSDGAILSYNQSETTMELWNSLEEEYKNLPCRPKNNCWYVKKTVQKLFKAHRKLPYYPGVHLGSGNIERVPVERISKKSENVLRSFYDYIELKKICYIRRDNLSMMNYLISKIDKTILPVSDERTFAPYYAVFSLKNTTDKKQAVQNLIVKGFPVLYWPDLPRDIADERTGHETAFALSEDIITIPIHQDITPQKICKTLGKPFLIKPRKTEFQIIWNKCTKEEWENLLERVDDSNIPQDWTYGEAKRDVEGWVLNRAIIQTADGKSIGLIQMLTKKVFGTPAAFRVNRGPLFLHEYNTVDNHLQVMESIKKEIAGIRPVFYAPMIRWSPESNLEICSYKWDISNMLGFPSGTIDLTIPEEQIRKSFDSKWRNQLVAAEKNDIAVINNSENFVDLVKIYSKDKAERGYDGIPNNILEYLNQNENVLDVYSAYDSEGSLLGFDIFYMHGQTSTYLVGWNSADGRKYCLNNLLLYKAIVGAKAKGMQIFDLGGIEDIYTENVAKFKRGTKPMEYRLVGEFVRL
ncbi:peptidoglycan bridge formation glycyltransferase FemA/FemB family protein [Treponema parvum]|uniref:peptidoglycan bridge formation glycyltransferase FemA/FemB family protein n=1 Tax=Treponema parvum TaxID=138851 RepID=UPI001AEC29A7|nr:peptidoglycan bridge formation glycyltransferase FemA/FemB family protein [Treponema parvum]QTQ16764.1 peptidoglycan bridge formation glycyltransferase FemA/FemB family protein [Treponema parvum]